MTSHRGRSKSNGHIAGGVRRKRRGTIKVLHSERCVVRRRRLANRLANANSDGSSSGADVSECVDEWRRGSTGWRRREGYTSRFRRNLENVAGDRPILEPALGARMFPDVYTDRKLRRPSSIASEASASCSDRTTRRKDRRNAPSRASSIRTSFPRR